MQRFLADSNDEYSTKILRLMEKKSAFKNARLELEKYFNMFEMRELKFRNGLVVIDKLYTNNNYVTHLFYDFFYGKPKSQILAQNSYINAKTIEGFEWLQRMYLKPDDPFYIADLVEPHHFYSTPIEAYYKLWDDLIERNYERFINFHDIDYREERKISK